MTLVIEVRAKSLVTLLTLTSSLVRSPLLRERTMLSALVVPLTVSTPLTSETDMSRRSSSPSHNPIICLPVNMATPVKLRRIQRQSPRLDIQYTDEHVKNLQGAAAVGDIEKETRTKAVRVFAD